MKNSIAVPVNPPTHHVKAWSARLQEIASFGWMQCQSRDTVHSAGCTITGSPEELVVNLACTAKSEKHVSELMQYVNDTLLPQMEKALGIQFEIRNLQFTVVGKEKFLSANWLDHPFAAPLLTPAAGLRMEAVEPRSDLTMA